ncbi:hypothetical protein WN943_024830 [Citrus x changshan-huyou]
MQIKTLIHPLQGCSPSLIILNKTPALARFQSSFSTPSLRFLPTNILHRGVKTSCISPGKELIFDENCDNSISLSKNEEEKEEEEEEVEMEVKRGGLEKQSIWSQMKEIVMFTGPATGLWLCGPLMSLIDTAVIGQGSSVELAALGPGTVMCDYLTYVFMFLSIATSNMVATSLARQDKNEVQHQISVLLFVGLACGFLMLLFTRFFGSWALTAFTGPRNVHLVPAANTYVQIRSFAWPAVLVGLVAQSASLGMKDSLGPLKALAVASAINGIGDVALCSFLGYGIAGAAWATMVSQVVSAYMMIQSLNNKGYNAFSFSVPSTNELATILGLAGPVFITMIAKVAFYSLIIYFATSMGTNTVAAHQVMIQTYGMCSVCGEPLSQTAQSFMPELIYGVNRSLVKARMLLKSLLLIGSTLGLVLGTIGASVPWFFPNIFTSDKSVIQEMHKVLIPYILAIVVSPSTHSLEGTLLFASRGYGLPGCWFALVCFQSARFLLSLWRLLSPDGTLYSEDLNRLKLLSQSLTSCSKTFLISTTLQWHSSLLPSGLCVFAPKDHRKRFITTCISSSQEFASENDISNTSVSLSEEKEEEKAVEVKTEGLADQSIWNQIKEIMKFTGPATGLWICGPLMSLIDTAVIGQGSSLELAALGPGTVLCDNMSYIFMFLSIATSNLVATSLTKQDKNEVQHQISVLLFVGLACGFSMLIFTKFFGMQALFAFTGSKNVHILPAANKYVQIRGLAWPAVLTGWVAQSASLGMKDSWGPLKALVVASAVNGIGDIVLCRFLGYGIAGAAWATMASQNASQVIAAYMMIINLNQKGYNAFAISIPLPNELLAIFELAAPVFVMMMSKVAFFTLLTYFATSMGTITLAAHQVMIQTLMMCTVWGEPLAQTAQSFMPEFLYGMNRNLAKARMLLKSLVIIGAILGVLLAIVGTSVPWLFPNIFTPDKVIVQEMHKVLVAYFVALIVTPAILSLEGTLLAGRDLKFVSFSMSGCFSLGALALLLVSGKGYGLPGCWYVLVGFQWTRFFLAFQRLLSPTGILFSENVSKHQLEKLKAA